MKDIYSFVRKPTHQKLYDGEAEKLQKSLDKINA